MNLFLSLAPGSASQTLSSRLIKQKNFLNKNSISFKSSNGLGHFKVVCSEKKLKKIKFAEKLNLDLLFYQHLLPTKKNLNLLFKIIDPDKTFFLFSKRNLFDTSMHFKNRYFNNEPLTMCNQSNLNYKYSIYNTVKFYSYWLKLLERPYFRILLLEYKEIVKNNKKLSKKLTQYLGREISLDDKIKSNISKKKNYELNSSDITFIKKTIKHFKCKDIFKKFEII